MSAISVLEECLWKMFSASAVQIILRPTYAPRSRHIRARSCRSGTVANVLPRRPHLSFNTIVQTTMREQRSAMNLSPSIGQHASVLLEGMQSLPLMILVQSKQYATRRPQDRLVMNVYTRLSSFLGTDPREVPVFLRSCVLSLTKLRKKNVFGRWVMCSRAGYPAGARSSVRLSMRKALSHTSGACSGNADHRFAS